MLPRRNSKGRDCRDQNSLKEPRTEAAPATVQTWGGCKGRWGGSKQKCRLAETPYLQMEDRHGNSDPSLQGTDLKSQNGGTKGKTHTPRQANNNFEAAEPARLDEKLKPSLQERRGLQQAAGQLTEDKSSALKTRCTSSLCGSTGQFPSLQV